MFRFDGVVFLFGTAIAAPVSLQNDKDMRTLRPVCEGALYRFRATLQGMDVRGRCYATQWGMQL